MSGHSKWSSIKHQKGVTDARRGQLFTKLAREIAVASRQGGSSPEMNVRLRLAVQKARDNNMPLGNIERAIKRGAGADDGSQQAMDEVIYEGYGPGGAAIFLEAVTDNPNRTVAEIRHVFTRGGGNMGEPGCVAWNFESRGAILVNASPDGAETLALLAIDAGADDFDIGDELLEIQTTPESFEQIRKTLEHAGAKVERAELSMTPKATMPLNSQHAAQTLRLLDRLEELDDVQRVYTNADFPDDVLEEYQNAS